MNSKQILKGLSVSSGIGIGQICIVHQSKQKPEPRAFTTVSEEKARLKHAMDQFCYQTYVMFQKMRSLLGQEDALILGGQIYMARDLEFVEELHQKIQQQATAEQAIEEVFDLYLSFFKEMEDEVMAQRGADLRDMRNSILEILVGQEQDYGLSEKSGFVLCTQDLTPSLMANLHPDKVAGIVCEQGGVTSHCAILARAAGIPAVFGVKNLLDHVKEGDLLVADGTTGKAVRNPRSATLKKFQEKARNFTIKRKELEQFRGRTTQNAQGDPLTLMANITDFGQVHTALELGADGVGLFRTEYLFLNSKDLPSEETQTKAYSRVAKMMTNNPVYIRTLDIGGDKQAECLPLAPEENPFLGHRGLRFCLDQEEIFTTQLRAILRAAHDHPNIAILLPFVTEVDEILQVKTLLNQCRQDLESQQIPAGDLKFGIVVETPAAAVMLDIIIDHVDYISVGTNDLTQYVTVADRGNPKVAEHYTAFHPAVLRLLSHIIKTCNQRKCPVTVCGEVACDPRMIPVLMAFGQVNFSVSPAAILGVRRELYNWTLEEAKSLTETILAMSKTTEIETYLNEVIQDRESRHLLFQQKIEEAVFQ